MTSLDNALTTLARCKSYLGISGSTKDLVLTMLILGATSFIQDTYCGRKFGRNVYTDEVYDGKCSPRLWVRNGPIVPGESLTLSHSQSVSNDDSWEGIDADRFYIGNNYVQNAFGNFDAGVQNYQISYTGGYYLPSATEYQDGTDDQLDLPYDLEMACLDMVGAAYNQRQTAGIKSQAVMDVSITYGSVIEQSPSLKKTLDKYKVVHYA